MELPPHNYSMDELVVLLKQYCAYAASIDEYGSGHHNVIVAARRANQTYCGRSVPTSLMERANAVLKERGLLREEIFRKALSAHPRLQEALEIMKRSGKEYGYDEGTLTNAYIRGLIRDEEWAKYDQAHQSLTTGDYSDKLKASGMQIKRIQEEFISFLESCLSS